MISQKVFRIAQTTRIFQRILAQQISSAARMVRMSRSLQRKLPIGASFTSFALLGLKKHSKDTSITAREVLIAKADALFEQGEYKQIYDMLQNYRDNKDVEILWRLCRALYNMSKSANDVEAKKMIYEGYDLAMKALAIKEDHYAVHKWIAVLLDSKSSYEGKKARIRELYNVKEHMLRSAALNPKDATIFYMIGNWCYQVSDLAWYQRKIAGAIFGEPPNSSFEEALEFFEIAEELDPNFYIHNLLMLGKSYLKLNRKEDALKYLKKASEYPAKNDDDLKAKQEATKLLGSM